MTKIYSPFPFFIAIFSTLLLIAIIAITIQSRQEAVQDPLPVKVEQAYNQYKVSSMEIEVLQKEIDSLQAQLKEKQDNLTKATTEQTSYRTILDANGYSVEADMQLKDQSKAVSF